MDDQNKNLILATVLSTAVMLVWFAFFAPKQPETSPEVQLASQTSAGGTESGTGAAPASTTTAPATTGTLATNPADTASATALAKAPRVRIETPRLSGSVSLLGGRFDDLSLKDYKVSLAPDAPLVPLLAHDMGTATAPTLPYYAVQGWAPAAGLAASDAPGAETLWQLEAGEVLTPQTPVTLKWDNGAGLVYHRTISVDDQYLFQISDRVENGTATAVNLMPYGLIVRKGIPQASRTYVLHEGIVRQSDTNLEEITYKNLTKMDALAGEGQAEVTEVTQKGWIGFTDRYWMTTIAPLDGQAFTSVAKYVSGADLYQAETRFPVQTVQPGGTGRSDTRLFAGAKEWEVIRNYQDKAGIYNFVDSIDWGWFFFLTKPMFRLLHWLHGAIGNMGWAIIALTILIKSLVFPLARKSYISMARMKELQPEMEKLKERFGDDRAKMQQETMALYKREKVNPASGCLPILIQIPIFFSLYKVIYVTIELYHAKWIGWIHDLSMPDPSSILNLFGALPWDAPVHGSPLGIISLGVLPILLGISMWFQQKLNPAPTDPAQAAIFAWMPWIFMFMLGSFASGLVLYWIANNTITFIQQYTIMSMHGKRPDLFGNIRQGFKRKSAGPKAKG